MGLIRKLLGIAERHELEGALLDYTSRHWELTGDCDLPTFLQALPDLVPSRSVIYLEGGFYRGKLAEFLRSRMIPEPFHIALGLLSARTEYFHIPLTPENLEGLVAIAGKTCSPEIAVHIHVHDYNKVVLEWHDALLDGTMVIADELGEEKIRAFALRLGLEAKVCTKCANLQVGQNNRGKL